MLDSDVVSALMRRPFGEVAQRIAAVGENNVATSVLVIAEIRFGVAKSNARRQATQLATLLTRLPVLDFAAPADEAYAQVRLGLERKGTPIGGMDMVIAAHALALGHVLVTGNEREFSRVDGLRVENWLR